MATDTSEHGLETLIVSYLRDKNGYREGTTDNFDKDFALDLITVENFIRDTQPQKVSQNKIFDVESEKRKFFTRLRDEITKRGVTDVLRKGIKFNTTKYDLYYPLPSELNTTAKVLYGKNIFGVIRQLKYSKLNENSIDFIILINGIPLATFELKNSFTGQTVENAIHQYQTDRDPKELLLQHKRCAVHMAVDDREVWMCTKLCGKESWFLPFNKGKDGGAGNPVNPNGLATAYLWENILTKESLSNIIENFAQVITETDKKTKVTKEKTIWPRYHQVDAVRKLLMATEEKDVGQRFLIQHSPGSGKSNTITWLSYQLVTLLKDQKQVFNSVVVITDRVNLDKQIRDNIQAFAKLQNLVGWSDSSDTLRELLQGGKKIIITTIHKFSYILDTIGSSLKDRKFAIVIDEAHSSQNGSMSANVAIGISGNAQEKLDEDTEDKIHRIISGRKMAKNANYYAFTATPKNKTLEMFGVPFTTSEGEVGHKPFHEYTMKQAIEEGFILDPLKYYTPYNSYYKVLKAIEDDPEFDKKKAVGKIRAYIERQPETIQQKSRVIVEHFCKHTFKKIGGQARAMVGTSSIERAIEFYKQITKLLEERKSQYKAIVAFTPKEIDGKVVTDESLNGFPSADIEANVEKEPYRILIVADMFQTGYDQPLLHTMYVDKQLSDLKAVQTLCRLNRCHPRKIDTCVLDFANDPEVIKAAFQKYYKTTILSGETDINKLNDLQDTIEGFNFYTQDDIDEVVRLKLSGDDNDRPLIDSILDAVANRFKAELDENKRIECKSAMKNFARSYTFIASIMPFESPEWEKMFIFYKLLLPKLPKLKIDDFTEGLLETIDFDKYRLEKQSERHIELENEDAEVAPVPVGTGGGLAEPEMDTLSSIIADFNNKFGNIEWKNQDEVLKQINELPDRLASSTSFVNAVRNSDQQTAMIQFNDEMMAIVATMLEEKTEFVTQYFQNSDFQNMVNERVFRQVYQNLA